MRAEEFIIERVKVRYSPYFTGKNLTEGQMHLNRINGTVPMNVWLKEIEAALIDNIITEAIDEDFLFKVRSLEKISSIPEVGESYIPIPIIVSGDTVYVQDMTGEYPAAATPRLLPLVEKTENTLTFKLGKEVLRYPQKLKHGSSYATVLLADNAAQYEKIRMLTSLYFNQTLLPIQLNESSASISNIKEFLIERVTDVVYHYTSTLNALRILQSGEFHLASVVGTKSEEQYAPEGHPYFLSLTRSRVGDYHRYVGSSGVMFVLDGRWINARYKGAPIDYWDRAWLHSDGTRTREAEDRVFSREPTIPITPVTGIHVLIKEQSEFRSPATRKVLILAKQRDIPAWLYVDEDAWRLQDTRKAVSPHEAGNLLKGPDPSRVTRPPRDYLKRWLELIHRTDTKHLSKDADKLKYDIMYYGAYEPKGDQNLGVDLSNARKPDAGDRQSAIKIIDYMRQNGFKHTYELKNAMAEKWVAITKKERETK